MAPDKSPDGTLLPKSQSRPCLQSSKHRELQLFRGGRGRGSLRLGTTFLVVTAVVVTIVALEITAFIQYHRHSVTG